MMIFFFFFYSLKMNEAWTNAPSLEHESMSLKKKSNLINFENNDASDDF